MIDAERGERAGEGWPGPDDACSDLAAVTTAAMARHHVPGVAVGVVQGDSVWTAGFGVNNINHPLPVTPDTLFQLGSISKTFAATAAMRLVEAGRLDLDCPVRAYLPDLRLQDPEVAARVTMRHLFTHTAGWLGDYFAHTGAGDDALARIVGHLATLPQLSPLGATFSYSNSGFYLAGRVIEVVTGQPYERAIRELVLQPLGLQMSFFRHFASRFIMHRVAAGHNVVDGQPVVTQPWARTRAAAPSGGIVSTVQDTLRYARFHLGDGTAPDGTRLLTAAGLAAMQTPRVPTDGTGGFVGLSWMLRDVAGTRVVQHGGSTFGQRAGLVLVPSRRFAIAVLTNGEWGDALHHEVTRWALAHFLGLAEPDPERQKRTAADLAAYAGRYRGEPSDLVLVVGPDGLLLRETADADPGQEGGTPTARLAFIGPDQVVVLDPPHQGNRGEFLRGPDGQIAAFRFGLRLHHRR